MGGEPEKKPIVEPSVVDDLFDRTRKFLGDLADDYVKRPIDGLLRWILGRAASYLVAAALFVTAAVFLLVAGVEGLKEAKVPPYVAYLALGAVGILAGLIILRRSKPDEKP